MEADTGKILLNQQVFHCDNPEPLGNDMNGYASPSPVIEPGRVYVHFGSYGTACLDTATFKILWKRDDLPCRHYRGPASSPIIFNDLLILTLDGIDLQYLTGLDKKPAAPSGKRTAPRRGTILEATASQWAAVIFAKAFPRRSSSM